MKIYHPLVGVPILVIPILAMETHHPKLIQGPPGHASITIWTIKLSIFYAMFYWTSIYKCLGDEKRHLE